jgi:hypothetical protein
MNTYTNSKYSTQKLDAYPSDTETISLDIQVLARFIPYERLFQHQIYQHSSAKNAPSKTNIDLGFGSNVIFIDLGDIIKLLWKPAMSSGVLECPAYFVTLAL